MYVLSPNKPDNPFLDSTTTTSVPFQLLHIDLYEPYKIPIHSGGKYILSVVDDHSRSLWTFLLKDKSSVHLALQRFFALIHNQFPYTVKAI